MRRNFFAALALCAMVGGAGCSSLSMPWSKSAPAADPTAEAVFADGMRYFKEKRYVRAIDAFTKLKTEHPFSPLLTEAELKIADAHFLNEQYPEAVNAFKEFQTLHPTNEHIPFVVFRLGEAHFNQFTHINRDPKNTEIAKGYFEAVLAHHPKSAYAADAREKLAKCNGILAEHDFNIAEFYFKQEKYPAARDRFEEIVRKFRGTPVASRSLFFLGESYRREQNNVKAALAYEALLQHYPEDQLAAPARAQLAQIEKEKQDPLAMLLMRDRRPAALPAAETKPGTAAVAILKDTNNRVAKTEVVYEAPGAEKGVFRRVVDKINPFASSESEKKPDEKKTDDLVAQLASKNKAEKKQDSGGFFSSLWPFGGSEAKNTKQAAAGKNPQLVERIDDSLKQKGIDAKTRTAALKTPAVDLPNVDDLQPRQETTDTKKLLGDIDTNLKNRGVRPGDVPPPPEAAEVFKDAEAAAAVVAKAQPKSEAEQSAITSGLLSSIDQKLKGKGVEPAAFEPPPAASSLIESKPAPPKEINLEPKRAAEKGPLFLSPAAAPAGDPPAPQPSASKATEKPEAPAKTEEPAEREIPRALVRGPQTVKPEAAPAKPEEQKKPAGYPEEENKGTFDQLRQDLESVNKMLNPFRW